GRAHRLAGLVHVRLGHEDGDSDSTHPAGADSRAPLGDEAAVAGLRLAQLPALDEALSDLEADVVGRALVLVPRVAQADDEAVDRRPGATTARQWHRTGGLLGLAGFGRGLAAALALGLAGFLGGRLALADDRGLLLELLGRLDLETRRGQGGDNGLRV